MWNVAICTAYNLILISWKGYRLITDWQSLIGKFDNLLDCPNLEECTIWHGILGMDFKRYYRGAIEINLALGFIY